MFTILAVVGAVAAGGYVYHHVLIRKLAQRVETVGKKKK